MHWLVFFMSTPFKLREISFWLSQSPSLSQKNWGRNCAPSESWAVMVEIYLLNTAWRFALHKITSSKHLRRPGLITLKKVLALWGSAAQGLISWNLALKRLHHTFGWVEERFCFMLPHCHYFSDDIYWVNEKPGQTRILLKNRFVEWGLSG